MAIKHLDSNLPAMNGPQTFYSDGLSITSGHPPPSNPQHRLRLPNRPGPSQPNGYSSDSFGGVSGFVSPGSESETPPAYQPFVEDTATTNAVRNRTPPLLPARRSSSVASSGSPQKIPPSPPMNGEFSSSPAGPSRLPYPVGPTYNPPPTIADSNTFQHPVPPQTPKSPRSRPSVPQKPSFLQRQGTESLQTSDIAAHRATIGFNKDDIIIAVMGVTGAGKSTFISLLARDQNIKIGHGLSSCTSTVGVYHFSYKGTRVFLVDTPGFDDTNRSDSEILKDVAFWLAAAYSNEAKLAGIIYLHRISDVRLGGSALRNLRMFKQLCGQNNLNSVILATTHWVSSEGGRVSEATGKARIDELVGTDGFWGGMVDRGSKVVRHDGSRESALSIIDSLVKRRVRVVLDIQRQLIDEKKNLDDTDAAQALQEELIKERKAFQEKLLDLKEDMAFAMKENDERWLKQLEEDKKAYEAKIKKTYDETAALRTNLKKISEEKDAQYKELVRQMEEQQRLYEKQIQDATANMQQLQVETERMQAEYEQQRREDAERAEREMKKYLEMIQETCRPMELEKDETIQEQLQAEKEILERMYKQQREENIRMGEAAERRWQRQQEENRKRYNQLEEDRKRAEERALEIQKESTKRRWYNPGRYFFGKYRI